MLVSQKTQHCRRPSEQALRSHAKEPYYEPRTRGKMAMPPLYPAECPEASSRADRRRRALEEISRAAERVVGIGDRAVAGPGLVASRPPRPVRNADNRAARSRTPTGRRAVGNKPGPWCNR